ncbi:ATP-grasp domain-containing protein [Convivina praedatoris]|uniref:ATP-grasp fold PylC-type domain-containing protein n=1 Tax=Convivina praedatoris TaxID=2880963 RepID=A0ABM9D409_9LACO|nr:ATP-grasp domain-containing protein [Convivina sp. LMG 32447]CAH1853875.1 hypothetical protein R077815_00943 [Convivina sp. LMG 32447]CAH1854626.1 hypothetical protein R078138_00924 [Convivina sp. LMG 32447]CAH1855274.1 hypothetical protein LMG032447_01057 [Convivina sp. LMG 32447]
MRIQGSRVLVTGARAPIAVALMSQLVEANFKVWATDSVDFALGRHFQKLEGFETTAPCRFQPNQYIADINAIVKKHDIDWILPSNEETFWLSRQRQDLIVPLFAGDFSVISQLHHKRNYGKLLQGAGLSVPRSFNEPGPDRIIKNDYSRFTGVGEVDQGQPYFYQEKITGKEWCITVIAQDGQIQAGIVYDKAFNFRGSSSVYFADQQRPDILAEFAKLMRSTNYTGLIGADLIESDADQRLYFIDINPRGTSGLVLLNANFWRGERVSLKSDRRASLALLPLFWRHPILTSHAFRHSKDIFNGMAIAHPYYLQFVQMYDWWRYAHQEGINLRQATVYDIEWDGE